MEPQPGARIGRVRRAGQHGDRRPLTGQRAVVRFMLCRTVRYVVVMLMRTVNRMTTLACSGTTVVPVNRNLSATVTPRIFACWALCTIVSVSPYLGAWPGFHWTGATVCGWGLSHCRCTV